jgi:uncharacterized protein with PCYCGC motif
MSKKQSQKTSAPPPPDRPTRVLTPVLVVALVVFALVGGSFWYLRNDAASTDAAGGTPAAQAATADAEPTGPPANARFGPHKQFALPALEFPAYPPPRPQEVVRAAYTFAAEHPEVLGYVPCFCGCQRAGHRGNDDCFVAARSASGDVTQWEPHGMECQICIDVAHKSEEMFKSGASVHEIRDAVDREWSPRFPMHTPTPLAPK